MITFIILLIIGIIVGVGVYFTIVQKEDITCPTDFKYKDGTCSYELVDNEVKSISNWLEKNFSVPINITCENPNAELKSSYSEEIDEKKYECYELKECPNNCSGLGNCDDKTGECTCYIGFGDDCSDNIFYIRTDDGLFLSYDGNRLSVQEFGTNYSQLWGWNASEYRFYNIDYPDLSLSRNDEMAIMETKDLSIINSRDKQEWLYLNDKAIGNRILAYRLSFPPNKNKFDINDSVYINLIADRDIFPKWNIENN